MIRSDRCGCPVYFGLVMLRIRLFRIKTFRHGRLSDMLSDVAFKMHPWWTQTVQVSVICTCIHVTSLPYFRWRLTTWASSGFTRLITHYSNPSPSHLPRGGFRTVGGCITAFSHALQMLWHNWLSECWKHIRASVSEKWSISVAMVWQRR